MKPLAGAFDENLLQGFDTSDDAAVYRVSDDTAAVLTVDFLTPLVDDPYDFGRLAAANALSDVFAMGARPVCALNVLALDSSLGIEVAAAIVSGGADACAEAGCLVVGGHSIDDDEPKFGLSVFGTVRPDKIVRNYGAKPGDMLYLTKALGIGVLSSAFKIGLIDDKGFRPAIDSMQRLNKGAADAMLEAGVRAATDVTGFGLAGHLHEMLEASGCACDLWTSSLPLFDGVYDLAAAYCRSNRTFSIMDYSASFVDQGAFDDEVFDNYMAIICDPQTSGGLLIAIPPEHYAAFEEAYARHCPDQVLARVGVVTEGPAGRIFLRR